MEKNDVFLFIVPNWSLGPVAKQCVMTEGQAEGACSPHGSWTTKRQARMPTSPSRVHSQ